MPGPNQPPPSGLESFHIFNMHEETRRVLLYRVIVWSKFAETLIRSNDSVDDAANNYTNDSYAMKNVSERL